MKISRETPLFFMVLLVSAVGAAAADSDQGADWHQYLGPNRNGVSEGPKLSTSWGTNGPPVIWQTNCLVGYSGPMVKDGVVILMERGPRPKGRAKVASTNDAGTNAVAKLPEETVRALDAQTGAEIWRHTFSCEVASEPHNYYWGSCATPAGVKDRVICQFLDGNVRCFELKTGKSLWTRDLRAEIGMTTNGCEAIFQACSSPLIVGDRVIIMACTDMLGLLALAIADGREIWRTPTFGNYGASTGFMKIGDASVVVAMPCYVNKRLFKGGDVLGFNAENGELLWCGNAGKTYYNAPPPIANEGILVVEGGSGDGPTFAYAPSATNSGAASLLWKDDNHLARWSNYLVYRGLVFGQGFHAHGPKADIGIRLFCNEALTGTNLWHSQVTERHHSMIASDDKVIQLHENGELSIFDATAREAYRELARARVVAQKGSVWSFPALVNGRLYVRTDSEVVCLDLTAK